MNRDTDMAVFVAVADAGGFLPAARQLAISHSALSKRIHQLEKRLGTQLLLRTTRSMALTDAGERYLSESRRILEGIETLEAIVARDAKLPRGTLRVSASNAFGRHQVAPAIGEFLRDYPDISIDLTLTDRIADIGRERIDVAIRSATLDDSALIARKLAPNDRPICASPSYVGLHGEPRTPGDLAAHVCLMLNFESRFNDWEFRPADGPKIKTRSNFTCNSVEALYEACCAGVGIARLPEFMVYDDLASGRLVSILNDARLPSESAIYAVRPAGDHVPARTRIFIDFLVDRFSPTPPWQLPRIAAAQIL